MRRITKLPREILYFAGIGLYGSGIGIVYWLVTREVAGFVLLTTFGAASAGFALVLLASLPEGDRETSYEPDQPDARRVEGAFGTLTGRIPSGSLAPLEVGFGIAVSSLSLAFGIWMLLAGIVPILAGAYGWIRSTERELIATRRDDPADPFDPGDPADPGDPGDPASRAAGGGFSTPAEPISAPRPAAEPPSA